MFVAELMEKRVIGLLPRMSLRDFSTWSDIALYLKWFNDESVRKMLHPGTPRSCAGIKRWMTGNAVDETKLYKIAMIDNHPIGHIGLKDLANPNGLIELSCVIGDTKHIGSFVGLAAGVLGMRTAFLEKEAEGVYLTRMVTDREHEFWETVGFQAQGIENGDYIYSLSKARYLDLYGSIAV